MNRVLTESVVMGCLVMIIYKHIPSGTPFRVFWTGFLVHIVCKYSGINRWFCRNDTEQV